MAQRQTAGDAEGTEPSAAATADLTLAALAERLAAGQCVLWAGGRLDAALGGADLPAVMARLLAGAPPGAPEADADAARLCASRPLVVAAHLRGRLGEGFAPALRAASAGPDALPESLTRLLSLPFRAVLSTSLGDLAPRALAARPPAAHRAAAVYTPADLPGAAREATRGGALLRALGDPARPATLLLSAAELRAALGEEQLLPVLRAHLRRTILFLGIDPALDLDLLLAPALRGGRGEGGPHYALLDGVSPLEREELAASFNIHVLPERPLADFIAALVAALPGPLPAGALDERNAVAEAEADAVAEAEAGVNGSAPGDTVEALLAEAARSGRWADALAEIDRRADAQRGGTGDLARLRFAAGRLAADHLGDVVVAEQRYHQALAADAGHLPAMTALVELHRKSGEFLRAARLLVEAAHHTTNRLDRTRFLVEAGEIHLDLDQPEVAIDLLRRALEVDPEHVEAASRLADLLWTARRYGELVPVLEMLGRKPADPATTRTRLLRLGRAARAAGEGDKSARAFFAAAEADPASAEVQREAGMLHYAGGAWAAARDALQVVLDGADESASAERADLYHRLGECERQLGHLEAARSRFAQALEVDPSHRESLLSRMELEGDDPRGIIQFKRALLATSSDDEKVRLLSSIGEAELQTFADPAAAIAAFAEALRIRPDARALLHRTLDIHVERKDWPRALATLERLVLVEQVPEVRAKMRFTRAMIFREELGDAEVAHAELGKAWDDDPRSAAVASALEASLVERGDWKELQRLYRRRIKTLPTETDGDTVEEMRERSRLWSAIADVSLDRLGEFEAGLSALEVAASLDPASRRREQLAELYVAAGAAYADRAIAAHQQLLRQEPDRIASYRALRDLYRATSRVERAVAVACALSLLGHGAPEDDEVVAEARRRPLRAAARALDDELWSRYLLHPEEDRLLGQLFALLTPTLGAANSQRYEALALGRRDQVGATDGRGFAKAVRYVQRALGVRLPFELYARADRAEAITIASCSDTRAPPVPCLILGQPLLAERRGERELLFTLSRCLAGFRPERYLRHVLTHPAQLAVVIDAAVALGGDAAGDPGPSPEAARIAADLGRSLAPLALSQVQALGRRLRGTRSLEAATAWLAGCDLTDARAASLLVDDLASTARLLAAADPGPAAAAHPPLWRLKQLVQWSVSEECFTLRHHLGLLA